MCQVGMLRWAIRERQDDEKVVVQDGKLKLRITGGSTVSLGQYEEKGTCWLHDADLPDFNIKAGDVYRQARAA